MQGFKIWLYKNFASATGKGYGFCVILERKSAKGKQEGKQKGTITAAVVEKNSNNVRCGFLRLLSG
ncbi:unnamed protein product [Sphenostylis stenocarpa]|uniref:Uncharacterized protein n=1 Tax=Sphenostylis stenocarpa TaxID=92480 RepID=A0AA86VI35_9FABA|nr:unnamed protein product [Sphenostylis stenocarpa]